jgi:hypothetical protein
MLIMHNGEIIKGFPEENITQAAMDKTLISMQGRNDTKKKRKSRIQHHHLSDVQRSMELPEYEHHRARQACSKHDPTGTQITEL